MSKYIVNIPDEVEWGVVTCRTDDGFYTRDFDSLEELNSDYINEHYGDLQDEAYQRGLAEGKKAFDLLDAERDAEYQRGLNDAWEAAKKIVVTTDHGGLALGTLCEVFGMRGYSYIMQENTAQEAIAKLKAYEEKQTDNCIEIGDEVEWDGDKYIVTYPNKDINTGVIQDYDLIMWDGSVADHIKKCSFVKTGNHYDIASILKEMQS